MAMGELQVHSQSTSSITIPVFDEELSLPSSIKRLCAAFRQQTSQLVISDNGSTDRTLEIAHQLAREHKNIRVLHLDQKGRGRALKHAWLRSEADVLSYMDVDLSTDLASFPALIAPLIRGDYDLAVGSRLLRPELTKRCLKREVISRAYNLMIKGFFRTRFSDAQCGFKAITRKAAHELLPLVKDNEWFFDTELLVLAEKLGYRIYDLPVPWIEDPNSSVKIVRTALQDIRGMIRLWRRLRSSKFKAQCPRFKVAEPHAKVAKVAKAAKDFRPCHHLCEPKP
jgi:glycosyltransferase involved in cell wall biosynthesis